MKIDDYSKYYIQGSDHYLIPKDVFKELFNEMINWKEESKKHKEVIDKAIEKINDYKIYCEENKGFTEYTDIEIEAIEPVISKLEDILKEVSE
jgi:hypothetical protein